MRRRDEKGRVLQFRGAGTADPLERRAVGEHQWPHLIIYPGVEESVTTVAAWQTPAGRRAWYLAIPRDDVTEGVLAWLEEAARERDLSNPRLSLLP